MAMTRWDFGGSEGRPWPHRARWGGPPGH